MSTVTRKQYKAFLQSDAFKMHPQRDEPKKEARTFRRAACLFLVLGLLLGVASFCFSSHINDQSADPQHDSIGYFLTILSGTGCLICMCAGCIILLTSGWWPIYSHLVHRENEIAQQLYKMEPLEFYQRGKTALLRGAEYILVTLARDVLMHERAVITQGLLYSSILRITQSTEQKRMEFQVAYERLKTAGLIEDVGYGYFYDLAKKQLAPQR